MTTTPKQRELEGDDTPNDKRFAYAAGLAATLFYLSSSGFHVLATNSQLPFLIGEFEGADEIAGLALTVPVLTAMVGTLFVLVIFVQGLKLCSSQKTDQRLTKTLAILWNGAFYSLSALTVALVLATALVGCVVLATDTTSGIWSYVYFCVEGLLGVLALSTVGRFLNRLANSRLSREAWPMPKRVVRIAPFVLGVLLALALVKDLLPAGVSRSITSVFLPLAIIEILNRLEGSLRLDGWTTDLGRSGKVFFFCFGVLLGWFVPALLGSHAQDFTTRLERTSDGVMLKLYPRGLIGLEQRPDGCFGGVQVSLKALGYIQVSPARNDVGSAQPVCWYSTEYPRIVATASGAPEIQYRIPAASLEYPSCLYRITVTMPTIHARFGPDAVVRIVEFGPLRPPKGFFCG